MRLGAHALTDPELLAVLFGTGSRGTPVLAFAENLLCAGGGLKALAQCDAQELCEFAGLGPARAVQMVAALELGRRVQTATDTRPRLLTPGQIFQYVWPSLCTLRREVFHVLCLNSRNALLLDARVAEGATNFCHVDPREVFRPALTARACAVVLVHNHPSGDPAPSALDLRLTEQLAGGARLLGLELLDHLIVGDGTYYSLLERGQLPVPGATSTSTSTSAAESR